MSQNAVYDSSKRAPAFIEEITESWKYRHMIKEFVRRDITTRYKRSYLGVLWTMLNPLGMMLIMTLVFYNLFQMQQPKFPLFVFTGLICWNFFAQVTEAAPRTLLWSGTLIHRVYLPRTSFALVALGGALVNFLLSFIPFALIMAALRVMPGPEILFVPVAIVLLSLFSLGVGLMLSSVVVYFPDVIDAWGIALMAWMYLSAIFYPYSIIPESYRWWFFNLNPIYHLILLFRDPLYYGNWPSLAHIGAATFVSLSTLLVGWFMFTRKADELAYRI
ncbi:MAG: ABC transporter permease [Coriobacteriia bacterium]|nr:ABC transporter permease [Coriobacteriia bacterium]